MIDVLTIGMLFVVGIAIAWGLYGTGRSYSDFQTSMHESHMAKAKTDKAIAEAIAGQGDE